MYQPSKQILNKYADVLIKFALNSGKGVQKGEVVYIVSQTPGMPLALEVYKAVLECGGYPLISLVDDDFKLAHIQNATDAQISFFPSKYYRGLADSIDHWVRILADRDPMFLKGCDPGKVINHQRSVRPFRDWLDVKEDNGKFTWTLCLYGTEGVAKEAELSVEEYWNQICRACFLNDKKPLDTWRTVFDQITATLDRLNALPIDKLHVESENTDLWITLGEKRRWLGGSGRNIPSFEIFTSPDWRGTNGKIAFDLPLYRYGSILRDIKLEFKNGKIVKATAGKNEKLLHQMIGQKNADKIGEFSLTDIRFSRITKFMANSLFDENFGGKFGNTHLAVGKAYHDTYSGNSKKMMQKDYEKLGFNHSAEHTDIIATTDRVVTAVMKDGSEKVIYRSGKFAV
jgi:aminopeptidase